MELCNLYKKIELNKRKRCFEKNGMFASRLTMLEKHNIRIGNIE